MHVNQASSVKGTDTATAVTIQRDIREGGKDGSEYRGQSNLDISHSMGLPFGDNAQPEGQERSQIHQATLQLLGELLWL